MQPRMTHSRTANASRRAFEDRIAAGVQGIGRLSHASGSRAGEVFLDQMIIVILQKSDYGVRVGFVQFDLNA